MEGTLVKIRADVVTEGALVITCFPSVGMVSSVVGHYLIDNLQLEFVGGVVDPRLFLHSHWLQMASRCQLSGLMLGSLNAALRGATKLFF